ncbi:alpha/beta hydrolase [Solirubrobacter sp. CPCC 204708]|uniref:Alpha/beta hydrolase n=1 Tax=Solirubrobacter deserti TaxID=2282478 RepID=A0ABT4RCQ5_9ACTN|nr:alpha/beta hydrolase [Solirubrobacter deserti]MBE2317904.1 alpha/beta hydrolase [Solirubrobacter deserti]MDA0136319.1 alpha/beta hydrolase [Solirubrobacter deserti]
MAAVLRQDVTLGSEVAAWLWHPEGATGAVVLGHGLSAVRDQRIDAYAERFAQAGLAALLFDYRHFGASSGQPRQLLDIKRQLEDWRTAVAYARGLDGIERVGLFGSSFGGGHATEIAASDPNIGAVVLQCAMVDGLQAAMKLPPKSTAKLAKVALQDELGSRLGRKPKYVPAVGRPGELAMMTTEDAVPGFDSLTPEGSTWVNAVAARLGLWIGTYRPAKHAASITCPILVALCEQDTLVSNEALEKVAEAAPQGELVRYPIGHFEIYNGEWFERAVTRQAEFLARHLTGATPSP